MTETETRLTDMENRYDCQGEGIVERCGLGVWEMQIINIYRTSVCISRKY